MFNASYGLRLFREYTETKTQTEQMVADQSVELDDLRGDVRKCAEMKRELESFSDNPAEDVQQLDSELQKISLKQENLRAQVNEHKKKRDERNGKKVELQDKMNVSHVWHCCLPC